MWWNEIRAGSSRHHQFGACLFPRGSPGFQQRLHIFAGFERPHKQEKRTGGRRRFGSRPKEARGGQRDGAHLIGRNTEKRNHLTADGFADGYDDAGAAEAYEPWRPSANPVCRVVPGRVAPGRKIVNGQDRRCAAQIRNLEVGPVEQLRARLFHCLPDSPEPPATRMLSPGTADQVGR